MNNFEMKTRGIATWAVFWAFLVVVVAAWSGHEVRHWSLAQLHDKGSDQLLSTINRLRTAIGEYHYLPFVLTQNNEVKQLLLNDSPEQWADVSRYLEQINLVAGAAGLFILDTEGRAVAYSHWREGEQHFAGSHSAQPYFQKALAGEQGQHFRLQHGVSPALFLSAPIYSGRGLAGVAVVRINLLELLSEQTDLGLYTVSDDSGQIFLSSRSQWQLTKLEEHILSQKLIRVTEQLEVDVRQQADGSRWLNQQVRLDDLGWTVTTMLPTKEVERRSQAVMLAAMGGGLTLGLVLLWLRERHLKHLSQQETRAAQARNEAQQRVIISRSEVGLITVNSQGEITFINPMALRQFGVSLPLVEGVFLKSLIAGIEQFLPVKRALSSLAKPNFVAVTSHEIVGRRGDGTEFPILFSIRRMQQAPDPQYLVTVIDITRRKKLEQALRQANESLEQKVLQRTQDLADAQQALVQAEKLAALGRMSSAMVHELNQPLTAMRTYIAICRQLTGQPEMQLENLQLLDELAERMGRLTQQLKVFAYKKPETLAQVSLSAALNQVVTLFRPQLEHAQVQLVLDIPEYDVLVQGDNARLEQIVTNLIQNSFDVLQARAGALISVHVKPDGERLLLQVKDNGPGIDPEVIDHLFEPFVTSKPMGSGLGLGLAIVASIVRDIGGEILAENNAEGGASFKIWLQPSYTPRPEQE